MRRVTRRRDAFPTASVCTPLLLRLYLEAHSPIFHASTLHTLVSSRAPPSLAPPPHRAPSSAAEVEPPPTQMPPLRRRCACAAGGGPPPARPRRCGARTLDRLEAASSGPWYAARVGADVRDRRRRCRPVQPQRTLHAAQPHRHGRWRPPMYGSRAERDHADHNLAPAQTVDRAPASTPATLDAAAVGGCRCRPQGVVHRVDTCARPNRDRAVPSSAWHIRGTRRAEAPVCPALRRLIVQYTTRTCPAGARCGVSTSRRAAAAAALAGSWRRT